MTRERDLQIDGPAADGIAEVMEGADGHRMATGGLSAARARQGTATTAATSQAGGREVFEARDAFGGVGDVLSWTWHNMSPDANTCFR